MKVGIIGCGNMGTGMAKRLSKSCSLVLCDHDQAWTEELAHAVKGKAFATPAEVVQASDIVILAVKPQNLLGLVKQIKAVLTPNKLLVSLLAGVTISSLKQHFGHVPILRMMPSITSFYGAGIVGLVDHSDITLKIKKNIEKLCENLGSVHWLSEDKIDALSSLTASGPAFALVLIESMGEAAIAMGFNAKQGQEFVLEMLTGTIAMLKETGKHPAELKWQVTSPAGTTIVGLRKLEEAGLRGIIMNVFLATFQKAKEMSAVSH